MLSIRHLSRLGLEPVSFDLAGGQTMSIVGPSGAGKSLLLRAIADLDPSDGETLLDDHRRDTMPAPEWRRKVGYLPAESGWWRDRVGDHFADPEGALPYLSKLGLPKEALSWQVARLSTGEKQRLALIRLLMNGPKILLLDEPTSGLDAENIEAVEKLLENFVGDGGAIIIVTHDAEQVSRLADRRYEMHDGKLAEAAP